MSASKQQSPADIHSNQYRVTVQGGSDLTQEIIERILGKQKNIANIDIVKIVPVDYRNSNVENEAKELKTKNIRQLFETIQKVQPDLQPQVKKAMRELAEIEEGLQELTEVSENRSALIKKNKEAIGQLKKEASDILKWARQNIP